MSLCHLRAEEEGLPASAASCGRVADAPDLERALVLLASTLQTLVDAGPPLRAEEERQKPGSEEEEWRSQGG